MFAALIPAERWKRNAYAVYVAVFISFLGFSFVLPFLPLYIQDLGVNDVGEVAFLSGIAFGVAPLFSGLMAPFWGMLADRFGVKIMVQRALISFAVINVLMAQVGVPWQLIVLRATIGIFGGFGPMTTSLVTIGAPQKEVASAIGRLQAVQILASAVGPLLGGQVADHFGMRASFMVTAALCAASFVVLTILYQEERVDVATRKQRVAVPVSALFKLPAFIPVMLILLFAQIVDRGFGPVIPLFVPVLDPQAPVASTAGIILSLSSFVSAIVASQIGRYATRLPPASMLVPFLVIGLAAVAPLVVIGSVWHLVLLRVFAGIATGAIVTLCYASATLVIPPGSRTTAFGFLGSATSLANALGPFGAGALANISLNTVFVVDACIYAVTIALAASASVSLRPHAASARATALGLEVSSNDSAESPTTQSR